MKILEALYACAETHLGGKTTPWDTFSTDFQAVFGAHVAVYVTDFGPDGTSLQSFTFFGSSDPEMAAQYVKKRIWQYNVLPERKMAPLEPFCRTELTSDEDFERLGPLADFMISHGMYYQMLVPALLSDGSIVGLFVWHDKDEGDFDKLEKQRLALFMRHLLALVGKEQFLQQGTDPQTHAFGQKWNLTETETEILSFLLNGLTLKAIAARSNRGYGTVRWHVQNILEKCQVNSQKALLHEFYQLIHR